MKTILWLTVGAAIGATAAWMLSPKMELVEAAEYQPVPGVHVTCDEWLVQDTSPDFYWDRDNENSTSTADYWTAKTIKDGVQIQSGSAHQGESLTVTPSDDGIIVVAWYDSDRLTDEKLSEVTAVVPDCSDK